MQNQQPNFSPQNDTKIYKKPMELWRFSLVGIAVAIGIFLLCVLFKEFAFSNYRVKQSSMEPTLYENDIVWVNKLANPQRGDIILSFLLDEDENPVLLGTGDKLVLIKRVVGLSGDKLWVEQSQESPYKYFLCRKTIDGTTEKFPDEAYDGVVLEKMNSNQAFSRVGLIKNEQNNDCIGEENALTVPENSFYCLGDNRSDSLDSRTYGAFTKSALVGVVVGKGMQGLWIAIAILAGILAVLFVLSFVAKNKTAAKSTAQARESNPTVIDFSSSDKITAQNTDIEDLTKEKDNSTPDNNIDSLSKGKDDTTNTEN